MLHPNRLLRNTHAWPVFAGEFTGAITLHSTGVQRVDLTGKKKQVSESASEEDK
jgi:hypothetical protein